MASKRQRPNFGALMATGGFGVPDPLGEAEISEDAQRPIEVAPIEAAPKTPAMPTQGDRSAPAAVSPPEDLAVSRATPAHLTVVARAPEPAPARKSVRVSEVPAVARRNRTWRAGDDEYDLLIDIERKIYFSGALGKSRRFGPSTVIRAALRLAAKMPVENVVEEILSANDIEE